jgi:hypothetical protein
VPGFKATYLRYLAAVESLSYEFTGLVAEALGLPSNGLARFYGARERMQHRSKVRVALPRVISIRHMRARHVGAPAPTHAHLLPVQCWPIGMVW